MSITLVKLSYQYKKQLEDMLEEWIEFNNKHPEIDHSPWVIFKNDYHDFDYYLNNLETTKEKLKDGYVTDSTFFCLDIERNIFVGAVNIRHYLNRRLFIEGGHIGDGIRPSERKKGYATKMLGLALEEAKKLGLNRVLLVCNKDNIGSQKQIIYNGGILENEIIDSDGVIEQRYWIELSNNQLIGNAIILRKAKQSDTTSLLKHLWSNKNVYETMWFKPIFTLEDAEERLLDITNLQAKLNCYVVALKDTDEAIGICGMDEQTSGIFYETGIGISDLYQGKGYENEVLSLLLDLVFNKLNGKEFQYDLIKGNKKSEGLKNHFGFTYKESFKDIRPWDNKEFELESFILTKGKYMKDGN